AFEKMIPMEMFGRVEFPPIGREYYFLTLGPHGFYWFSLETPRAPAGSGAGGRAERPIPGAAVAGGGNGPFLGRAGRDVEAALPGFLAHQPWFGGKAHRIQAATIREAIPIPGVEGDPLVALVRVDYFDDDPEGYTVPLARVPEGRSARVLRD